MRKKTWRRVTLGGLDDGKKTPAENVTEIIIGIANRLKLSAGELVVVCSSTTPPRDSPSTLLKRKGVWVQFAIFTNKKEEEIYSMWSLEKPESK